MSHTRNIRIKVENYQDISKQIPDSLLLSTIIFTQCKFLGRVLKETEKILLTTQDVIQINAKVDLEFRTHDLQSFISTPITFVIFQQGVEHDSEDLAPSRKLKEDLYGRKMRETWTQTENSYHIFGSFLVDLKPILFGERSCKQFLEIDVYEKYSDEHQPGVNIEISIDNPIDFRVEPNLLTLTIESIFNVPQTMTEELEYQIYIKLPFSSNPTIFKSTTYKQEQIVDDFIKWLNFDDAEVKNTSQYKINLDIDNIKNDVNVDLATIFESTNPRIEFNTIQRYFLIEEDFSKFVDYIDKISSLYLEIFCISETGVDNLHLMAIIDLSSLQNPEIKNLRIATPIYNFDETIFKRCLNYEDATFQETNDKNDSIDHSLINNSKETLEFTSSEEWRLNRILYNEDAKPTFIIIEIDLLHPINDSQKKDHLYNDLELKLIAENCKRELINETLKEIINETIGKYGEYLEQRKRCICSEKSDFLTYLQRTGFYQSFLYLLTQLIILIVQNVDDNQQLIEQLSEEFYCEILKEFNLIINEENSNIFDKSSKLYNDLILLHAQEAIALQNYKLANKYHLQNIALNENNPNSWLYYGIYQNLCGQIEKAFTCVQKALNLNKYHCLSLLFNGILLTHKNQIEKAEKCFGLLDEKGPQWIEGTGVFCLFHKRNGNEESFELYKEKAETYLENGLIKKDYFESYNMIWTKAHVSNTVFLRTCLLLIDLKMFDWAEEALSLQTGYCEIVYYLLGVICYYTEQYSEAIENLEKTKLVSETPNDAILSLMGHCYYHLNDYEEALKCYHSALEVEEKSINFHLIYINLAKIYKRFDDFQNAKEFLLLACKSQPTAQTWSYLGKLYYTQKDLISAEECFSESLMYDNHLSETWYYLSLINSKLCRFQEADIYQEIAIMNNFNGL